jgi:hypothetical protein
MARGQGGLLLLPSLATRIARDILSSMTVANHQVAAVGLGIAATLLGAVILWCGRWIEGMNSDDPVMRHLNFALEAGAAEEEIPTELQRRTIRSPLER